MTSSDRPKNPRIENRILDIFGRKIAVLYDGAVQQTTFYLPGGNPSLQRRWEQYLAEQPDDKTKQIKFVQKALESLLHDILFCLQEQREYRIQALSDNGQWVNLDELSDGIHGELFDWLEHHSKYGCVTNEFLKIE